MIKRILFPIILLCTLSAFSFSDETVTLQPFTPPSARNSGMGGTHITNLDGVGALLYNPAGLVGKKQFSLMETTFSAYLIPEHAKLLGDAVKSMFNGDSFGDTEFGNLLDDDGRATAHLNFAGPLSIAFIRNGFGIGLFSGFSASGALNSSNIQALANANMQLNAGYGFKIINGEKHALSAGLGLKGFYRVELSINGTLTTMMEAFEDVDNFMGSIEPVWGIWGLSMDLALQYSYKDRLSVALSCSDLFSYAKLSDFTELTEMIYESQNPREPQPDRTGRIKRSLNAGFDYRLINSKNLGLTLMADYRDILDLFSDLPRNPILNLGLGAELSLLKHIFIRAGISDALPALGLGFDIWVCKLDFSIYGKELGLDPGVQPVLGLDVGLLFRW